MVGDVARGAASLISALAYRSLSTKEELAE